MRNLVIKGRAYALIAAVGLLAMGCSIIKPPFVPTPKPKVTATIPATSNTATRSASPFPIATAGLTPSVTKSDAGKASLAPLKGTWRIYSERLFYDRGGGSTIGGSEATRTLEIGTDGKWRFGGSAGTCALDAISDGDWVRWGIASYGPRQKITLKGWSGGTADGPVEESAGRIDFLWAVYRAVPPAVNEPGTVFIKFGRP